MESEQITSFLSALATEISNYEPHPTVQSAHGILSNSEICKEQSIRCICGNDMQIQGKELVRCTKCGYYLHKACFDLPINSDFTQFVCPICNFQVDGSDPLSYLTSMTDKFNKFIDDFAKMFTKGEEITNELPYKLKRLKSPNEVNYYSDCFKLLESNIRDLEQEYMLNLEKLNEIGMPPTSNTA